MTTTEGGVTTKVDTGLNVKPEGAGLVPGSRPWRLLIPAETRPGLLHGRSLSERERSPCYTRIKTIVARRLEQETSSKHLLLQPAWSLAGGKAVAARARGKL